MCLLAFLSQIEPKNMKDTLTRMGAVSKDASFNSGAVCYAKARRNRLESKPSVSTIVQKIYVLLAVRVIFAIHQFN